MGEFDWDTFIENLWERENAHGKKGVEGKGGYRNGKYYPYKTPNGNTDIGPGFDIDHQSAEFKERAKKGFTKKELDSIVKDRLKDEIHYFNQKIATEGGDTTNIPDNIYAGLLDMQWQVGNGLYSNFPNLWKAVAKRDYDGMRRESEVTYLDSKGNRHVDTGRRDFRNSTYFNGPSRTTIKPIFPSYAEQPDAIKPLNPYSAPIESRKTGYGPYKDKYSFTESEDRKAKIKKAVEARQLYNKVMDATSLQNTALPQFKSPFAEGGFLQSKDAWDKLSMYEKAAMMKVAVQNGITNLQDIRQKYNEFAEGGNKEDEYYSQMEKVAEENYKDWGYYENNPSSSANASTHWPDAYKTVYHPTFSNESIYSGTVSQYNPLGLPGGFWVGDTFIPRAWQVDASMNKYKNGGGIHIKPSHRGRLTELKKRTGKSEAELYNDGNPAHKRMVVFARNARKWKHGEGGNLYGGTTRPTQKMQIGLNVTNGWPNYTLEQILANAQRIQEQNQAMQESLERKAKDYLTASNDATAVANGRLQNQHLVDRAIQGAKAHAAWEKGHPTMATVGLGLGAVPFAVAALPAATLVGDAAAATTVGKGITTLLTNPYFDAAMTSIGGAHAAHSIANREADWTTALELAPMIRPAKAVYDTGKAFIGPAAEWASEGLGRVNQFMASPYTGKWTQFGNTEYRFRPGYIGMNGVPVEARTAYIVETLPGFQLKRLMVGSPLEKQLSKTGTISKDAINAQLSSGNAMEKSIIDRVLNSPEFADQKAVDYNKFRKAVQDELITYDRVPDTRWQGEGIENLGYVNVSDDADLAHHFVTNPTPEFLKKYSIIEGPFNKQVYNNATNEPVSYVEIADWARANTNILEDAPKPGTFTFETPRIPVGNAKHYNRNTLGHIRTFTRKEEPDVLYVMENQSDWAQNKPKELLRTHDIKSLDDLDAEIAFQKRNAGEGYLGVDWQDEVKQLEAARSFVDPETAYLADNYERRQIYESLKLAAQRGHSKMRFPTYDTTATIEGYPKVMNPEMENLMKSYRLKGEPTHKMVAALRAKSPSNWMNPGQTKLDLDRMDELIDAGVYSYNDKFQHILRRSSEFPKRYKKLYKDADVRTVKDGNGHTWYEIDVPKDFLNQEWQYKYGGLLNN